MDAIKNLTPEQRRVLALFMHDNDTLADPERDFACALTALESLAYNAEHVPRPSAKIYLARLDAASATLQALLALPYTTNTDAPTVDWLWWGSDANDVEHISFGRWQSHPCQHRYKLAAIQPTEHDHPQPLAALAKGDDAVWVPPIEQTTTNDQIAAVMLQTGSPAQVRQALAYAAGNLGASTPTEGSASQTEGMGGDAGQAGARAISSLAMTTTSQVSIPGSGPKIFATPTQPETAEAVKALAETQSLLVAMLHETRPREEIEKQIAVNRAVLGPDCT